MVGLESIRYPKIIVGVDYRLNIARILPRLHFPCINRVAIFAFLRLA